VASDAAGLLRDPTESARVHPPPRLERVDDLVVLARSAAKCRAGQERHGDRSPRAHEPRESGRTPGGKLELTID
jgi:hypothetical protein